ncbi:MAG: hypothetical protein KI788_18615, partial [Mameliella sp.]|nr:hypothetical protein [Mameliella sp.]
TLDRATPMAAMETFLYLAEHGHFSVAAHLLDLSDVAPADQQSIGTERARMLSVILERKVVIPWSSLEDRPDGWLSGNSEDNDTGRERRSILIDRMERGGHLVPLRLNRIKAADTKEPVWVFSRQSVDNIPALYALYGPTDLELALPEWLRTPAFWGMFLWEVLFLPLVALAALIPGLAGLSRDLPTDDVRFRLATVTHARLGVPAFGVAPGEAELYVTLRTLLDDQMADLEAEARGMIAGAARGFGTEITVHEAFGHCVNAPEAVALLERAVEGLPRKDAAVPMRASEDFGLFGSVMPSAMFFLGAGEEAPALHNPDYDFPDDLIAIGASIFLRAIDTQGG